MRLTVIVYYLKVCSSNVVGCAVGTTQTGASITLSVIFFDLIDLA
jgi:hypothetical protein